MSASDPIEESALAAVRRWPWERYLSVLIEDALYGPLGVEELRAKAALCGFDLAAGELVASFATDREGRRRAAEVLCGGALLALLSPHGSAEPAALAHLEHARRGLSTQGITWGGLARFARAARDRSRSPAEQAAAVAALWASHLALGDSPGEAARMGVVALSSAFAPEVVPQAMAVALAHMERVLADRPVSAEQLLALVQR